MRTFPPPYMVSYIWFQSGLDKWTSDTLPSLFDGYNWVVTSIFTGFKIAALY